MTYQQRPSNWEDEPQWDEIDADSEEAAAIRAEYDEADSKELPEPTPVQVDLWADYIYKERHRKGM